MSRRKVGLTALTDVVAGVDAWEATSDEPWLRVEVAPSAGRWLRIEYASGLLDPLTRPLLRFVGRHQIQDELLPAAMLGRAIWIGQAPRDVVEIRISPTLGKGRFAFRIERWDVISPMRAFSQFRPHGVARVGRHLWGRMRGWEQFARLQARRALGATPLADYESWREARVRPYDSSFDGAAAGPRFRVEASDLAAAERLQPRLAQQTWPHWTLGVTGEQAEVADEDYVLNLSGVDDLEPHALAAFARAIQAEAGLDAVYADEDSGVEGQRREPRLKPDWSPLFSRSGYLGAPFALRGAAWKAGGFDAATARVAHVRRVLVSRRDPPPVPAGPAPASPSLRRRASILIPTRDRLDLLQACVESLSRFPLGADHELLVLDNGSAQPETLAYLERLEKQPDCRVLRMPGPFNFSAICNQGAREATAPFLLFLNDDVEALSANWLGQMLEFAAEKDVGAVGAKLLYPDGRLQHAGVVLGLDGFAGHVQRLVGADDPGYLGELAWPREVAAVTGACLAVEARKFNEIGGFDEARLPIEYNDIDLCLRLGEAGYKSVFEPRARLMHRESASRGANPRLDSRYASEHAYFRERWARRLRDDPYFHPTLSLDALEIALG